MKTMSSVSHSRNVEVSHEKNSQLMPSFVRSSDFMDQTERYATYLVNDALGHRDIQVLLIASRIHRCLHDNILKAMQAPSIDRGLERTARPTIIKMLGTNDHRHAEQLAIGNQRLLQSPLDFTAISSCKISVVRKSFSAPNLCR